MISAPNGPRLRAEQLAIGYVTNPLAAGLNIELPAASLTCLLGPNGIGKSTLLRTLAGLQPPLQGGIWLDDKPLAAMTTAELARRVAVVLTDKVDAPYMTVGELAALGRLPYTDWWGRLSAADERQIEDALRWSGAAESRNRQLALLSDGERQKAMIARALAQDTPVLILDEPTVYLDLPRRIDIMRLLRSLARASGKAVLLSSHDLDLALQAADRLWVMTGDTGGIQLHQGTPKALLDSGVIAAAFAAPGVRFDTATGRITFDPESAIPESDKNTRGN